ncbi:ComEC/Rec2 family competence protein [bacterium]
MLKRNIILLFIFFTYIILSNLYFVHKIYNTKNTYGQRRHRIAGEVTSFVRKMSRGRIKFTVKTSAINNKSIKEKISVVIYEDKLKPISFGKKIEISAPIKKINTLKDFLIYNTFYYIKDPNLGNIKSVSQGGKLRTTIQKARYFIIQRLFKLHKNDSKRFVPSFILGDKNLITKDEEEVIRKNGISHILVVSGTHVGLLIAFVFAMCFGKKNMKTLTIVLVVSWIYVFLNGFSVSCMRAVIMFNFATFAYILERDYSPLYALLLAAAFILLFSPSTIFSIGFQFSFFATFGILYYFTIVEKVFMFMPAIFRKPLALTTSAQIGLAPIIFYYFTKLSIVSFISNIFVVPLVFLIMIVGISAFLGSLIFMPLGILIAFLNDTLMKLFLLILNTFAKFPYVYIEIENLPLYSVFLYYGVMLSAPIIYKKFSKRYNNI